MDDQALQERVAGIEALIEGLESLEDPVARSKAMDTIGALLELYGEGLARVMEAVGRAEAHEVSEDLVADELVSHLLFLHGLHPVSVEERVAGALEEVRPYLGSHGGDVEFLRVEDGVAYLRMQGSCDGCPSSAVTLKLAIEEAVLKAVPEVGSIEAEGVTDSPSQPNLIPLQVAPALRNGENGAAGGEQGSWAIVGGLPELSGGGVLLKEVSGEPVLFMKLEDNAFYAYRHLCPGCEESLEAAALGRGELACAGCGNRYDVRRAGRCLDAPRLYLEPIPLLVTDAGIVKVALPSSVG